MINCHYIKEYYLFEYIDGELDRELQKAIAEHLLICNECHTLHQMYSRLIAFCRHCCNINVPEKVHAELWQMLNELFEFPNGNIRTRKYRFRNRFRKG
jgi:anti-sigma factor RsiW